MNVQNEEVFMMFKILLSLNGNYLIEKFYKVTKKEKNNKEYVIGNIDKNGIITIVLN